MEILECIIIKMYINNKKAYYIVTKKDYEEYQKGNGLLPFIASMKYKKYLLSYVKSFNNKETNKKIKIVKE